MLIVVIKTVNISEHSLCTNCDVKLFTCIISFNSVNPMQSYDYAHLKKLLDH